MPRVVHFEIVAKDPERVARFYADAFGWTVRKWEGPLDSWAICTGQGEDSGIDGGAHRVPDNDAPTMVLNTIDVPSVDEYMERVKTAGGEVISPKMPLPTVGWLAYCRDTEGIVFAILQPDPEAG
jgi:predicted enzyme related to lactoylglutathione lyase